MTASSPSGVPPLARAAGLVALLLAAGLAPPARGFWTPAELPGGDVRALAVHPGDPDRLLAGTAAGQIYVSSDGGERWTAAGESAPFLGWVVSSLLFDPERPERVWAALRGLHFEDGFVAMSEDGGRTWIGRADGLPRRQVYALAAVPGALFAATRIGVFGTWNGGSSWSHLTAPYPEIEKVGSLLVDPADPRRLLAGTWRRAYRSDDGGQTWRGVFDGMILDSEVFSLHATPDVDGEIWASTCGWVYRSRDGGDSWVRFRGGLEERRTPSFLSMRSGVRLAGTVAGLYRSEDDGVSWQRVTPADLSVLAIVHHPARPERIFVGSEGAGVWRSDDGGRTFRPANRGLHSARIAALTAVAGEVIAAVRHSGPASGIYSSFDNGRTYPLGPVRLPTVVALASDGETVLAATEGGLYERREDSWRQLKEVGDRPVYQLVADGGRVVARTATGLHQRLRSDTRFEPLSFGRGRAASIGVEAGTVWVASADGRLFRIDESGPMATASPVPAGLIHLTGGALWLAGSDELWMRRGLASAWREVGRRVRPLTTGSREYPLLLIEEGGSARLVDSDGSVAHRLTLDHPEQDHAAALLLGRRLLLGTAGYGLLIGDLGRGVDERLPTPTLGRPR